MALLIADTAAAEEEVTKDGVEIAISTHQGQKRKTILSSSLALCYHRGG
jgi:hypothetical protein